MAFVRSGWAKLDGGSMRVVGQYGYYWSRTSISTTNAYVLYINPTGVNPSGNGNRFVGLPSAAVLPLPPLGTTWVEAAEGETVISHVTV